MKASPNPIYQDEFCTIHLEASPHPSSSIYKVTPNYEPHYSFLIVKQLVNGQWQYRVRSLFLSDYQACIVPYVQRKLESYNL